MGDVYSDSGLYREKLRFQYTKGAREAKTGGGQRVSQRGL